MFPCIISYHLPFIFFWDAHLSGPEKVHEWLYTTAMESRLTSSQVAFQQWPLLTIISCSVSPPLPLSIYNTVTISLIRIIHIANSLTAWYQLATQDPVQFSPVAQSCPTLCDPMNRSTPGLPVHHQLPEFTQTHTHRVSGATQPSHPLLPPSPPAPNPSSIKVFSNESTLRIWWPKYWSFSFSISPSNEHPGMISHRISKE